MTKTPSPTDLATCPADEVVGSAADAMVRPGLRCSGRPPSVRPARPENKKAGKYPALVALAHACARWRRRASVRVRPARRTDIRKAPRCVRKPLIDARFAP